MFIILLTAITMTIGAYILCAESNSQCVTLLVFGFLAVLSGLTDLKSHVSRCTIGHKRIARHLTNMLAGTIATVTATLVVNVSTERVWIAWITPTLLIAPVITYWNRRTLKG